MALVRRRMFQDEMNAMAKALENAAPSSRLAQLVTYANVQLIAGSVPAMLAYKTRGGRPRVSVMYRDPHGIPALSEIEFAAGVRDAVEQAVLV